MTADVMRDHPGQGNLIRSQEEAGHLSQEEYKRLDDKTTTACGKEGIDKVLRENGADIILGPADSRLPDITALASEPPSSWLCDSRLI